MSWIITGKEADPLLLDSYSGAAAAYSLRQLSWAYGGPVVRVRRDNDNAEQDFTATEVSDGTLAAWVGAGNDGFVRTWYDQSGNSKNAEQSNTSKQPKLIESGAIASRSGLDGCLFNGSTTNLVATFNTTSAHYFSGVYVSEANTVSVLARNNSFNGSGYLYIHNYGYRGSTSGSNAILSYNAPESSKVLISAGSAGSGLFLSANGSIVSTNTAFTVLPSTAEMKIGSFTNSEFLDGVISELLFYNSDQSANRTAIEANINAHYSIF